LAARTSSSRPAGAAILLGILAVLAIPAGVAASKMLKAATLIECVTVAVPVAFVLGLAAMSAARRARYRLDRSVFRNGARLVRVARFFAWTGLYASFVGAIALAVYAALRWSA
jgi:hypothetical protein